MATMKEYYHVEDYGGQFFVEDAEGGQSTGPFQSRTQAKQECDKRNKQHSDIHNQAFQNGVARAQHALGNVSTDPEDIVTCEECHKPFKTGAPARKKSKDGKTLCYDCFTKPASNPRQRGITNAYSSIQYGGRVKELLAKGMTPEEIAKDTGYPLHAVELTITALKKHTIRTLVPKEDKERVENITRTMSKAQIKQKCKEGAEVVFGDLDTIRNGAHLELRLSSGKKITVQVENAGGYTIEQKNGKGFVLQRGKHLAGPYSSKDQAERYLKERIGERYLKERIGESAYYAEIEKARGVKPHSGSGVQYD